MASFRLEIAGGVSRGEVEALEEALAPYGAAYPDPARSFDLAAVALVVTLVFDAIQAAGVLVEWLKRTPRASTATLYFPDGRMLRLEAADPDALARLLAALER